MCRISFRSSQLTFRPAPDSAKPQAKVHLQLAQTFYVARMQELKDQIMGYEARFTWVCRLCIVSNA